MIPEMRHLYPVLLLLALGTAACPAQPEPDPNAAPGSSRNPLDDGREFYCAYDPISGEAEPYDFA